MHYLSGMQDIKQQFVESLVSRINSAVRIGEADDALLKAFDPLDGRRADPSGESKSDDLHCLRTVGPFDASALPGRTADLPASSFKSDFTTITSCS